MTAIPTLLTAAGVCCSDRVWAGWAPEEICEIFAALQVLTVPQECWVPPSIIKDKVSLWAVAQNSLEGLYQIGFPQVWHSPSQVQHHHDVLSGLTTAFTAVTPSVLMLGFWTRCWLFQVSSAPQHSPQPPAVAEMPYVYFIYIYTFKYLYSQGAKGRAGQGWSPHA